MLRLTPGSGLFLTLTFENRPSIQCNLEGVSLSRKIGFPYRNFSLGEGSGKILSVLGGPKPPPVYRTVSSLLSSCTHYFPKSRLNATLQVVINGLIHISVCSSYRSLFRGGHLGKIFTAYWSGFLADLLPHYRFSKSLLWYSIFIL